MDKLVIMIVAAIAVSLAVLRTEDQDTHLNKLEKRVDSLENAKSKDTIKLDSSGSHGF